MRLVETVLMTDEPYYPGLEGVIAGETQIATVDEGLTYRGYPIEELADEATFLEVAYLLLHGGLPNQEFLADFQSLIAEASEIPPPVLELLEAIPMHVGSMDVLRTAVSAVSHFDPQLDDNIARRFPRQSHPAARADSHADRGPAPLAGRRSSDRTQSGTKFRRQFAVDDYRKNADSPEGERAMDVSLILYAEHEFNASTFTARVVTSTLSDLYSAVTAAIGALKGPLHGGANERVMEVLEDVGSPIKCRGLGAKLLSLKNAGLWVSAIAFIKPAIRGRKS